MEEVTADWKKLEKTGQLGTSRFALYTRHHYGDHIKEDVGMWQVWETREMHREFWWAEPKTEKLLGRPRRRWENNIKIDLKEIKWKDVGWPMMRKNGWGLL